MTLADVYHYPQAERVLYRLLEERRPEQNISHKRMPTWEEHLSFVRSAPYVSWYLILTEIGDPAGAVYLSKQDEIGVFLFDNYRGRGLGPEAVRELMRLHPRPRFIANIAPTNPVSRNMFAAMGFVHVQEVYAHES